MSEGGADAACNDTATMENVDPTYVISYTTYDLLRIPMANVLLPANHEPCAHLLALVSKVSLSHLHNCAVVQMSQRELADKRANDAVDTAGVVDQYETF